MSSSNPYSYPPNTYMDLLNSQQDSQPNQYTTPLPSQPVDSIPTFSSQPVQISTPSVTEDCIDLSVDENEEEAGRGSRTRWSSEEDITLISAWLNTSKDPIVSNLQKFGSFWKRVADYFQASERASSTHTRGPSQCKARWNKINHQVNKFVGCYTQTSARRKSGESEDDVMSMACQLYKNDMHKPFVLGHCWRELKHDQKWISQDSNKKPKLDSDGSYVSTSTNDGAEQRPPGVKASKKKGKQPVVSNDGEDVSTRKLDKIIAMKDKEQEAKDRQGKMRLLESLLNKPDLTQAKVTLRDKLTDQLLSNT
ncbi:PREDICTED: glutathione S-transferase T3-like [Camelina sativa]|uniref:Glutathione S-transferase T3-like n=1 Tax=Camelina sativa TaxID=90675 RepID=A0ABM0YJN9_CAMSA|nr:PREDICTED: glutathione S-transferase T3-like [Camelina sativa]